MLQGNRFARAGQVAGIAHTLFVIIVENKHDFYWKHFDTYKDEINIFHFAAARGTAIQWACGSYGKRGSSFATKYEIALAASSVAVIIANNDADNPNSIMTPCGVLQKDKRTKTIETIVVYPPLVMLSYNSSMGLKKALERQEDIDLLIRSFTAEDLSQDIVYFGAILRGSVAYGYEDLVNRLIKHLNFDKKKLKLALEDIEIGRGAASLHIGIEYGRTSIVAMLLRAGANTESIKSDGFSPLQIAVEQGSMECISLLLSAGAYPDHTHPVGWPPLHTACKAGSLKICKVLVDAGANINYLSMDDCSALHIACLYGHVEVVTYLLKSGVNYRIKNKNGNNALSLATFTKNIDCVNIIKKAYAFVPERAISWPSHIYFSYPSSRNKKLHKVIPTSASAEKRNMDNLGAIWLQNLEPIVACMAKLSANYALSPKQTGDFSSLLSVDIDRCCFVEYRSGPRRNVLLQAAIALIADGRIAYKQGLLSLLAVLVHVFVSDFDLQADNFGSSIEKICQMFHIMLYMFEPLETYYTSSALSDDPFNKLAAASDGLFTFSDVFDLSFGILHFLEPEVFSVLAWRNIHPSLFAVPWLSTLLADVRPLEEVVTYWSSLINVYINEVSSCLTNVIGDPEGLRRIGVRLLAAHVTSVLMQYSLDLLCGKRGDEIVGEQSVDKHFLFPASASLTDQDSVCLDVIEMYPHVDNLLLLFASINNPEDGEENERENYIRGIRSRKVTKSIDVRKIASDTTEILRMVGDSIFTFRSSQEEECSDHGNVWQCLTSVMHVSLDQIVALAAANELKNCVIVKMYGRFCGASSVLEGRVSEVESYLQQNNGISASSLQFRDLQVNGMIAYFRSYARSLCTDAFESRKTNSNVWTGVLADPPRRKPVFAKPFFDHALEKV